MRKKFFFFSILKTFSNFVVFRCQININYGLLRGSHEITTFKYHEEEND